MNELKEYTLRVIENAAGYDFPILFRCQAEDFDHATEQALNAYPDGHVVGTEDGTILSELELEKRGIRVFQDACRGLGWVWEGDEEEAILPTYEEALASATQAVRGNEQAIEDGVVRWLVDRFANGELTVRDLCERAVRYGQMHPRPWAEEMRERLIEEGIL